MKTKKIISIVLTAILLISLLFATAYAEEKHTDYWPAFRGISGMKGISDAKSPISPENTELKWKKKISAGWSENAGFPIEVGEVLYVAVGTKIRKLDKETGEMIKEGTLQAKTGFFSTIAYGDGKVFVPIDGGLIQAFDAQTLDSLWVSQKHDVNFQSLSPITYHDGHVYMGASNGSAAAGVYFCVSTADEDSENATETKNFQWTHVSSVAGKQGYYWSEGAVVGNNIIFAGEDGIIVSHSLTTGDGINAFSINEPVRSSVHYDRNLKRIYMTTSGGNIHSIKINADGAFDTETHLKTFIAKDLTSSPVTYGGRLYVGGGGISSSAPFSVFNAETLELIYNIPEIKSQSSPALTMAYATVENNQTVYIYLLKFTSTSASPDRIYCVKDSQGQVEPSFVELANSPNPSYNSSSLAIGKDGTLYYKNDSGHLFAMRNKSDGEYLAQDVINAIDRLPEISKIKAEDELLVNVTKVRFDDLFEADKINVTNSATLQNAINRIIELKNLSVIIPKLISDIDSLPLIDDITLADKENVLELWQIYDLIPELDKISIPNASNLIAAKNKLALLSDALTISEMKGKIDALNDTISMTTKKDVDKVYGEFILLSVSLQNEVTNSEKLITLREKGIALESEIEAIDEAIWALDPEKITLEDMEKIENIIIRYNKLPESDRALIEYYSEVLDFKAIVDKLLMENLRDKNGEEVLSSPKSGDSSPIGAFVLLMSSLFAVAIFIAKRKKA